jgi:aspartate/methionine/tyrosine aminotransferase
VNETAQFAVPRILDEGGDFLSRYRNDMRIRRDAAVAALSPPAIQGPSGGFHIVATVGREIDEEDLVIELLLGDNILVHPGYYYDIDGRHIVMAFVHEPDKLGPALNRVRNRLR